MGVIFPADLEAWQRWQSRRSMARQIKQRLRPSPAPNYQIGIKGTPMVAVAFETSSTSSLLSLGRPLDHLDDAAVIVPEGFDTSLVAQGFTWHTPRAVNLAAILPEGGVVLSTGHYLPLGNLLYRQSRVLPITFVTVQHGLMTPLAPPVAPDSVLLSWSAADADFWAEGQRGVEKHVVGSQLLWQAALKRAEQTSDRPVFLGQLHGAELPRTRLTSASFGFCRETGASYRPHPAERDLASRATHAAWARLGIEIDTRPLPVHALGRPVVSIFSTGVLEAAASGLASFVSYPNPPRWLGEFWERYGMREWRNGNPTPAPKTLATEPARAIADAAVGLLDR